MKLKEKPVSIKNATVCEGSPRDNMWPVKNNSPCIQVQANAVLPPAEWSEIHWTGKLMTPVHWTLCQRPSHDCYQWSTCQMANTHINSYTQCNISCKTFHSGTSCAHGDTICPPISSPVGAQAPRAPPSRRNIAVLSHAEYVSTMTAAATLCVKAVLSKAAWWPWPLTSKVVSESRVTWATSVSILVFQASLFST